MSVGAQPLVITFDSTKQLSANSLGLTAKALGAPASFGALWESTLHKSLRLGIGNFGATLMRGDAKTISFKFNPTSNLYTADADVNDTLEIIPGGYRFTQASGQGIETYNAAGKLLTVADNSGNTLSYTYSTVAGATAPEAGYLLQVSDNVGRTINFEYTLPAGAVPATDGLVSKISNTAGQSILVTYDATQNLQSLTWPDGQVQTYLYENANLPWALTGVIDERNNRYSTFTYDAAGHALSTEHAGGVNKYVVSYSTAPQIKLTQALDPVTQITLRNQELQAPVSLMLTKPNGDTANMAVTTVLGYPMSAGMSQPAGSGCNASNSYSTYDAKANLVSRDDFNGQRICYAYDAKNQEVTRVEGLANTVDCATVLPANATLPVNARKVTTAYHPDWRIPTMISAPASRTTRIYQGQSDPFNGNQVANCTTAPALPNGKPLSVLCKQVVQATLASGALDNTVANTVSQYTYDTAGRVLTSTDSLNRTTTYAYYSATAFTGTDPNAVGHTIGDLQSITNPNGHTTTFDSYDKLGRILQTTDPKGIVTQMTYTPRGWVNTVTSTAPGQTARTTTYSYDGVGQLIGVSNPDGSSLAYTYDAAHRLIGATDAKGNSVMYTLDNMGNRIKEDIKDPGGVLQRSIERSFDALNRLQQVSGAVQ